MAGAPSPPVPLRQVSSVVGTVPHSCKRDSTTFKFPVSPPRRPDGGQEATEMCRLAFAISALVHLLSAQAFSFGHIRYPGIQLRSTFRQHFSCGRVLNFATSNSQRSTGFTPSIEEQSRKVYDATIINDGFEWSELKDTVPSSFTVPSEPVFYVDYSKNDERFIAEKFVERRVIPILQKAKVNNSKSNQLFILVPRG